METVGSGAHFVWVTSLISAVIVGVALGFIRAWWFMVLGLVVPVALVIVSRFVSNDHTLSSSQDGVTWRAVLLAVTIEVALLFFLSFAVGARLRTLIDFLSRRYKQTASKH
jgi:hypothetical protein